MSLRIIKSGILDTVQDGGRQGYAHMGIPPSGAMDPFSASLANAILGKELTDPVIEIHFPAPVIEVTEPCVLSVTGADFSATINGLSLPLCQPALVTAGGLVEFKKPVSGARGYIGVYPGLKLEAWLNSYSTNLQAKAGGWEGQALRNGDSIQLERYTGTDRVFKLLPWNSRQQLIKDRIRIVKGPEWDLLDENMQQHFLNDRYTIGRLSNRMGFRLKGTPLIASSTEEMLSSAVLAGTIQLLPDGDPVVLMADHPTTGGYPRIASVIGADLGLLAQLIPGSALQFSIVDLEQAEQLFLSQNRYLEELKALSDAEMRLFLKG